MSVNQRERLAAETGEEREARLQQMSTNQCQRLAAETGEEREAKLQQIRDRLDGKFARHPQFCYFSLNTEM